MRSSHVELFDVIMVSPKEPSKCSNTCARMGCIFWTFLEGVDYSLNLFNCIDPEGLKSTSNERSPSNIVQRLECPFEPFMQFFIWVGGACKLFSEGTMRDLNAIVLQIINCGPKSTLEKSELRTWIFLKGPQ